MKRLQLVEDDDGIAELVKESFAREGLQVERFRDAESALLALGRWEPDAILLDLATFRCNKGAISPVGRIPTALERWQIDGFAWTGRFCGV